MLEGDLVRNKIRFAESLVLEEGTKEAGTSAALIAILDALKEIANALDRFERLQPCRVA